jgi:hypothetical protein
VKTGVNISLTRFSRYCTRLIIIAVDNSLCWGVGFILVEHCGREDSKFSSFYVSEPTECVIPWNDRIPIQCFPVKGILLSPSLVV